jgi:streptomycin 6-kinase
MRAESLGEKGTQWIASLDEVVRQLEAQWEIKVGEVLSGGSESLVTHAQMADGRAATLKIGLPGSANLSMEAKVFALAAGRGYAELIAHDAERNALLLERLGPPLSARVNVIDSQIHIICSTLKEAWIPLDASHGLMTGAQKAEWLASFISERWQLLNHPCDKDTIDRALGFAQERAEAFSPDNAVLVHGDAHANNTLLIDHLGDDLINDGEALRCKFIDPDGLFAEKACDLAVPMRDWSHELLAGDTLRLSKKRSELLAELTDVDEHAIWQWGFVERVSTGLVLLEIGLKSEGLETLAVADRLSSA